MSDFLEDKPVEITEAEAAVLGTELTEKVQRFIELDAKIAKLKAETDLLVSEFDDLALKQIPDIFLRKHVSEFKLDTGLVVGVDEKLYASVPSKDPVKKREALNWLLAHEGSDLITKDICLSWSEEMALRLQEDDVDYTVAEAVNTNSLMAFLREKLGWKKNSVATLSLAEITPALNPFLQKKAYIKK